VGSTIPSLTIDARPSGRRALKGVGRARRARRLVQASRELRRHDLDVGVVEHRMVAARNLFDVHPSLGHVAPTHGGIVRAEEGLPSRAKKGNASPVGLRDVVRYGLKLRLHDLEAIHRPFG